MAFSVNKAILLGNVARKEELRYTEGGTAVLQITVATNRSIKKGEGYEDVATFHRVIIWAKKAEYVDRTISKGNQVYIEGRMEHRSYEKDGEKKYISELVADEVIIPNIKGSKASDDGFSSEGSAPQSTPKADDEIDMSDIPF